MLPLWIIDITGKSDRRDAFQRLLGKIKHVYIPEEIKKSSSETEKESSAEDGTDEAVTEKTSSEVKEKDTGKEKTEQQTVNAEESNSPVKKTLEEQVEEANILEAVRNSVITGDYWYYSVYDNPFDTELTDEEKKVLKTQFLKITKEQSEENGSETPAKESESAAEQTEAQADQSENTAEETETATEGLDAQAEKPETQAENPEAQTEDPKTQADREQDEKTYSQALKLYRFQEKMVQDGKDFIHNLRKSNVKPYQSIYIVVLGDATEEFTRTVFPSIAAILQKEKGRYWTAHIHQGLSILGALFVPCNVNNFKVEERNKILHMLDEIEVQHNITAIRGYDHMMLYQDVQNRTECTYHLLEGKEQAEYLLQCMVHLFLATNINTSVISGTGSEDTFYFSMGAASVYFDMHVEDENDVNHVAKDLIDNFKEDGDSEDSKDFEPLLDKEIYSAEIFIKEFKKIESMDIDEIDAMEFNPHPILNYFSKKLKKLYYQVQLRYFPAALLRKILNTIEEKTSNLLDKISATSNSVYKRAALSVYPSIVKRIAHISPNDGGLSHIQILLRNMQELMSKERERVREVLETQLWDNIIYDTTLIPKNQKDYFIEYHDIYKQDIASKNDGAGCANARQEALNNLKALLSKEKTTLATLGRSFLMGIICVLALMPILDLISPYIINLGDVKKNALYWGFGIFLIPIIIQWIAYLWYVRKRNAKIRILKAYYTHDAYARLANRIEFEANEVYLKLIQLGGEYLERCDAIRKEVNFKFPLSEQRMIFPRTKFNQPLNGGDFNGQVIIPESEIECSRLRVNYEPRPVTELRRPEFFILINFFNEIIGKLFSGVEITASHDRRYNDKIGDYEFVSKGELLEKKKKDWADTKKKFHDDLLKGLHEEMLPREYPTVGDKLVQYKKKIDKYTLLEPLMAYAATNGEITSEADKEYADIKVNREMYDLSSPYLPYYTTRTQVNRYDEIYKKYIFITRWRTFEHFSYNRILPTEDFDMEERAIVNYDTEIEERARKQKENERLNTGQKKIEEEVVVNKDVVDNDEDYEPCTSSLILWAVCPDENSSEWLKLIEPDHFGRSYQDREKYREVLNQDD